MADALRSLQGVQTQDAVGGPYDIIGVVGAPDLNPIGELVTGQFMGLTGQSAQPRACHRQLLEGESINY